MVISTLIQHITFSTNPPTRAPFGHSQRQPSQRLRTSFPHATRPQGLFAHLDSPLPADTLPGQEKVSRLSRLILPWSTTEPKYMNPDGSASWNSTSTHSLPSQHRLLILHCVRDHPLYTTPKTACSTQTRTNSTRSSPPVSLSVPPVLSMSLVRADVQSGDARRLFGFTMPW